MADDASVLPPRGRPRRGGRVSLLRRVADALVDGDRIQWDAAEALGRTTRERTLTRQLRAIAWLAAEAGTPQARAPSLARVTRPGALERALSFVAVLQVVAALATWLLISSPLTSTTTRAACVAAGVAAAATLLLCGRGEVRARTLAHVLLLVAALQARPLLDLASASGAPMWIRAWWQAAFVEAFLPVALWRFARECPLVVRFTRFDLVSRGVLAAALGWSLLLAAASAWAAITWRPATTAAERWFLTWQRQDPSGPFWTALLVWAVVAIATMAVRARQAGEIEARRVQVLLASIAVGIAPLALLAGWRGDWLRLDALPSAPGSAGGADVLVVAASLALPWLAAAPQLLHEQASHRRTLWQRLIGWAPFVFAALLALALLVPASHLYANSSRPLNVLLLDLQVRGALAVAALALALLGTVLAWNSRQALRRRLRGDHASGVAGVAADVGRARTPREVGSALVQHLQEALDTPLVAVLLPAGESWTVLAGAMPSLPGESAVAAMLAGAAEPMRVDPSSRLFSLLPAADRAWLRSAGIEAIAHLAAPGGQTVAGLVIGARRDGRPHSKRDLSFVSAAASTAAIALDARSRRAPHHEADEPEDDDLPFECGACGRLAGEDGPCECGDQRALASLPARLGGKFQLERRIGRGGMGIVYLAVDTRLGRLVALKTLPRLSPAAVSAMHAEARAMAAVEHPSVALLYGLEVWRDTPVLVVEYLGGGTLASRLAQGPLPLREALALGTSLADALAELHRRGWLHRDVKPSNIGFGRGGAPKLLDFGLTQLYEHARPAVVGAAAPLTGAWDQEGSSVLAGTPLYLSPEAIDGCPAGEHMDVWALSLVVFEMVAGVHPFRAASLDDVLHRVRQSRPVDVRHWAPATPPPLAQLLQQALHPHLSQRIASASELSAALRVVAARL